MHCPIDRSPLRPIEYEGCLIHTCDQCGGEAVGSDAIARIVNVRERIFGHSEPDLALATPKSEPAPECARHLACPFCDSRMACATYSQDSGVVVDRCASCGCLWLDREEIEAIQAIMERWQNEAPSHLRRIAQDLEEARRHAERRASGAFQGSRFSFVNAIINRVLDAA